MATRTVKSKAAMCIVTIEFDQYLLPAAKGLQLVALMQTAVKCDSHYSGKGLSKVIFTEVDPQRLELEIVNQGDIKPKPAVDSEVLDSREQF